MLARAPYRVDLRYGLFHPVNGQAPGTQSKTWFFDAPQGALTAELLHRIFYDANVRMRRREPNDHAYLGLVDFEVRLVEVGALLAWDGKSGEPFPWFASQRAIVWEPGACFIVADDGRYDNFDQHDFTELLMNRLLDAGVVDPARFVAFFDRYFPNAAGSGQSTFEQRAERTANLVAIRAQGFRKPPGAAPFASGPPLAADTA